MADAPKTFGGLVMTRDEDANGVTLTLTCATHFRDWKVSARITREALLAIERNVLRFGVMRSDRGAIALREASQSLMKQARHSLATCRCASPLLDEGPCDACARAMYGGTCDRHAAG